MKKDDLVAQMGWTKLSLITSSIYNSNNPQSKWGLMQESKSVKETIMPSTRFVIVLFNVMNFWALIWLDSVPFSLFAHSLELGHVPLTTSTVPGTEVLLSRHNQAPQDFWSKSNRPATYVYLITVFLFLKPVIISWLFYKGSPQSQFAVWISPCTIVHFTYKEKDRFIGELVRLIADRNSLGVSCNHMNDVTFSSPFYNKIK